jgi:hypothetical protein
MGSRGGEDLLVAGKEAELRRGARLANGSDSSLDGLGPLGDVRNWQSLATTFRRPKKHLLSCGSFMIPKATFEEVAYSAASWLHRLANCAFVGPPWPMMPPFHLA